VPAFEYLPGNGQAVAAPSEKAFMYRSIYVLFWVTIFLPAMGVAATLQINPTTTLGAQTSNNTSAADAFVSQSNGNLGPSNISKLDVHSLLYPGSHTKVFAHLMLWFGGANHMNVGYKSTDPAQVKRQILDMIDRGIDGVTIDWYGPNNTAIDQATKVVMAEAEAHPGFKFAVMIDQGAIKQNLCSGCTAQQTFIQLLQYVEDKYFPSPAYFRIDGSPVVTNFDIDRVYQVDWTAAKAALATNPSFIFQDSSGFNHVLADGSYSWVMPTTSDFGMSYLTDFYQTGLQFPQKETVGATYKGFNDTLAAWGSKRMMGQQCGQTWLQTFAKANSFYDSTTQLDLLQLVTWNDYEEGTEIESGIDNCVSVSTSVAGDSLSWKITGQENTVDHYTPYISSDGQNLMPLNDLATGQHALNMCSYSLAAGNYTLFVQAVGKASFKNQISAPAHYSPHCTSRKVRTTKLFLKLSAPVTTIVPGKAAKIDIAVTSDTGSFDAPVWFSCSNVPDELTCNFAPSVITPNSATGSSVLTISASNAPHRPRSKRQKVPITASWFILGIAGFAWIELNLNRVNRKVISRSRVASLWVVAAILLSSCGGGVSTQPNLVSSTGGKDYTITITGVSGTIQASTTQTITIQ